MRNLFKTLGSGCLNLPRFRGSVVFYSFFSHCLWRFSVRLAMHFSVSFLYVVLQYSCKEERERASGFVIIVFLMSSDC